MSYSTVSKLTFSPEPPPSSLPTSSLCNEGAQLSMTRIVFFFSDISLSNTKVGEGLGPRPTSAYTTNSLSKAHEPTSVSNSACTNRVFPTPERPTRRTDFPPSRSTSLTRSSPSIRLRARPGLHESMNRAFLSGKKGGYSLSEIRFEPAHWPYGSQPFNTLPFVFKRTQGTTLG